MKEKFVQLMDKIEDEYEEIQDKMRNKNKLAIESIMKALEEIINLV